MLTEKCVNGKEGVDPDQEHSDLCLHCLLRPVVRKLTVIRVILTTDRHAFVFFQRDSNEDG